MINVFQAQRVFMEACGQTVDMPNDKQRSLYRDLIDEEFREFANSQTEADKADAVIDIMVVLIGYGLSRGWPMEKLWDEVMRSNMAKIDPKTRKVRRREDGKILKPEGWTPPNISAVLERG
jgi:predicted HAD superfamily Cof-like phosphohydrolase